MARVMTWPYELAHAVSHVKAYGSSSTFLKNHKLYIYFSRVNLLSIFHVESFITLALWALQVTVFDLRLTKPN
jgi:uncharacterized membrane protein